MGSVAKRTKGAVEGAVTGAVTGFAVGGPAGAFVGAGAGAAIGAADPEEPKRIQKRGVSLVRRGGRSVKGAFVPEPLDPIAPPPPPAPLPTRTDSTGRGRQRRRGSRRRTLLTGPLVPPPRGKSVLG